MPAPKPSTVSSEMKNKVWNVSLKTFVLKGLLKKFKGRAGSCGAGGFGYRGCAFPELCEKTS